jgi:hypothetical protein
MKCAEAVILKNHSLTVANIAAKLGTFVGSDCDELKLSIKLQMDTQAPD